MALLSRAIVRTLPAVPKPIVRKVASRYVAGETLDDAVRVVRSLNEQGAMATVDVLGEEVHEREKALAAVEENLRVYAVIARDGLDANVSIKPTLLGLKIDEGFCRDNIGRLAEAAKQHGNFVRIDMEDHTTTDATLGTVRDLRVDFPWVGAVLQSQLRRTEGDCRDLAGPGSRVRLCKGAYDEPEAVAFRSAAEVDLLTVLAHELGHELGLDDLDDPGSNDELMARSLRPGERRLPTAAICDWVFGESGAD